MYLDRLPRQMKWLTWLLFLVYVFQADVVIFLVAQVPLMAALHPVLALIDFALGMALVRRAWSLVRQPQTAAAGSPTLKRASTN